MANEFYTHGTFPSPNTKITSAAMRSELDLITVGFDKLPTLTGNGGKLVAVNAGGTGMTVTSTAPNADKLTTARTLAATGDLAWSVSFDGTGNVSAAATLANSGVTAGTYTKVTVDAKGRVTTGAALASTDVTTALGFTPYNSTNPNGYTSNTGTVTSVGGTGTVSGLSLSGTVTGAGNLTLGGTLSVTPSNFASQTANYVLAAPNGTAGTPTFRSLAAADIPTLNQNTTGSAAKWTTARTESLTGDVTGSTTVDGSANYSISTTLATVNSNVGSFGSASAIPVVTVNAKGLVTAVSTAATLTAGTAANNVVQLDSNAKLPAVDGSQLTGGVAKTNVKQNFTAQQAPMSGTLTDGANIDWNGDVHGQVVAVTLGGNRTMNAPTNIQRYALYIMRVTQDATGSRTLSWNAAYKFGSAGAPTLTTTASKVDILSFIGGSGNTLEYLGTRKNAV